MTPMRFVIAACALLASAQARAQAVVVYLKGDVRDDGAPVALGQRIPSGTTVTTGSGAQVRLRFSDRQEVVLDRDSAFRVADSHYAANEPQADRASFELPRGALRFVSGAIAARNPGAVALRTPLATFSVRGTDFMVSVANRTYLKVRYGAVGVTNDGGTVVFGADTAAAVTSASSIARPVFARTLPPVARGRFESLAAVPAGVAVPPAAVSATAAPRAAASAATGAASAAAPARVSLIDARTAARVGIVAALIAAAASGGGGATTTHH